MAGSGPDSGEPERSLLDQALQGDMDGLTKLLVLLDPVLRGRLRGQIPARHRGAFDVDDVLQVTYCEAFLRFSQFNDTGNGAFVAWLTRVAENNLIDAIRELERMKRPPRDRQLNLNLPDDSHAILLEELVESGTSPTRHATRAEMKSAVEAALDDLPPDYASVIRLYDLEGRSMAEVANDLGRRPGAAHMLRIRARQRLAELLGDETRFFSHSA